MKAQTYPQNPRPRENRYLGGSLPTVFHSRLAVIMVLTQVPNLLCLHCFAVETASMPRQSGTHCSEGLLGVHPTMATMMTHSEGTVKGEGEWRDKEGKGGEGE